MSAQLSEALGIGLNGSLGMYRTDIFFLFLYLLSQMLTYSKLTRTPEDKWLPHAVQTYSQSNRVTVMVWGAFNGHGCSELVICTGDPEAARGGVSS